MFDKPFVDNEKDGIFTVVSSYGEDFETGWYGFLGDYFV